MSHTQARPPRPVASERTPLKARKVSFSWEDTPLHWVPGDPFAGHTITSASGLTAVLTTEKVGAMVKITYSDSFGSSATVSVRLISGPAQ